MKHSELQQVRDGIQGDTQMLVCNREAGSFSRLWGRECWVANSVLGLIQSSIDEEMDQHNPTDPLYKVWLYCEELKEKNRIGDFPTVID
jgi:hypothetical protein